MHFTLYSLTRMLRRKPWLHIIGRRLNCRLIFLTTNQNNIFDKIGKRTVHVETASWRIKLGRPEPCSALCNRRRCVGHGYSSTIYNDVYYKLNLWRSKHFVQTTTDYAKNENKTWTTQIHRTNTCIIKFCCTIAIGQNNDAKQRRWKQDSMYSIWNLIEYIDPSMLTTTTASVCNYNVSKDR